VEPRNNNARGESFRGEKESDPDKNRRPRGILGTGRLQPKGGEKRLNGEKKKNRIPKRRGDTIPKRQNTPGADDGDVPGVHFGGERGGGKTSDLMWGKTTKARKIPGRFGQRKQALKTYFGGAARGGPHWP